MTLDRGAVHVWYAQTERLCTATLLHDCVLLLPRTELDRWRRLRTWRGRREYLLTRELVRTTLSRYAAVDPRAWRFTANRHGRPEIEGPRCDVPLRFNVSHTPGLIVCAVARDREVGADVEAWDRPRTAVALADRFFSASEAAAVRALPPDVRDPLFVRLWTLKEAYVKARGLGLPVALHDVSFTIEGAGAVGVRFDDAVADDPRAWQFALLAPTARHCVAVAARRDHGAGALAIELKKATIGATDGERDAERR